jgi:hypothetical protein
MLRPARLIRLNTSGAQRKMNIDNIKMWSCAKYPTLSVMASTADAFCAKRFEASMSVSHAAVYSSCVNCKRGAIQFQLGKHNVDAVKEANKVGRVEHSKTRHLEQTQSKGETNMKEWHKSCDQHGPYTATGPRGGCPKCKAAKEQTTDVVKAKPGARSKEQGARSISPSRRSSHQHRSRTLPKAA